jgi:hypothetical protein
MSSSCDKVPITTANQLLASGSRTLAITSTTQSESNTHTLRAMLHSSSACLQESSAPQSVHRLLCAICRWWRTSAEGRDCLARFQRNNLTFDRTCTCHSSVHSFSSRTHAAMSSSFLECPQASDTLIKLRILHIYHSPCPTVILLSCW